MGRRKKEGLPPIKLVIGRSPDQKKGKQNDNYTVLNQTVLDREAAMRAKRKASNIDPKKWKEQDTDDDDDDIEILQVYKPPPGRGPKARVKSIPQSRAWSRAPSLVMECVDEELSVAQKTAFTRAVTEYEKVKKRIDRIRRSSPFTCTEEILESYIGPETTTVKHVPAPQGANNQRPPSPDVQILDGPTPNLTQKIPATTSTVVPAISGGAHPTQPPPPPSLQMTATTNTRPPTHVSRPQDVVLMGPNGQPIVIPGHLMPQGNQPIVLQANPSGQLQIVGSGGQVAPVRGRPFLAPNGKMPPPLAPRMSAGMPNPNMRPPPPLQNMANRTALKRPNETSNVIMLPSKRTRNRRKQHQPLPLAQPTVSPEDKDTVNWVPLDEYYYSKKEGDPAYREEKGEYRFKCFYCFKMLYNNLRIMMHIQGHIDSEKQQNLDLSDLTQCKHCYKQFDTPFEMQCHVEKIHQSRSNVLVCRICEKDHTSQGDLKGHMRMHNACEMPYICQLCNFRSSVYNDVVDHFKKRHDSSRYMVCLYCLKVFEIKFAKNAGWGMTQTYYQHLLKHQGKATKLKCSWCKLVFNNKQELQMHKSKDHMPNYRGTQASNPSRTVNASSEQVMIRVPDSKSKVKSLNAPDSQRLLLIGFCDYFGLLPSHMCIECKQPMLTEDHYKKYTECSMCRFATTCNEAFAVHMNRFHLRGKRIRRLKSKEKTLPRPLFCLCGYSSECGNKIANHLISCSKRTCYAEKPEAKWFEYDDEQEEFNPFEPYCEEDAVDDEETSPEKDVPSLFGALGLVKKPPSRSYSSRNSSKESSPMRELSPAQVAQEVIDDILDAIFPAEASSAEFIGSLMNNVMDEIDEIDKRKFRSLQVIEASRRLSSDNISVNTESTSDQKWEDLMQERKTESPAKSSVFTDGDADYQIGDEEDTVSSLGGSHFNQDSNSMDSEARISSFAASEDAKVEQASAENEHDSNMDWAEESNSGTAVLLDRTDDTKSVVEEDHSSADVAEDDDMAAKVAEDDMAAEVAEDDMAAEDHMAAEEAEDDMAAEDHMAAEVAEDDIVAEDHMAAEEAEDDMAAEDHMAAEVAEDDIVAEDHMAAEADIAADMVGVVEDDMTAERAEDDMGAEDDMTAEVAEDDLAAKAAGNDMVAAVVEEDMVADAAEDAVVEQEVPVAEAEDKVSEIAKDIEEQPSESNAELPMIEDISDEETLQPDANSDEPTMAQSTEDQEPNATGDEPAEGGTIEDTNTDIPLEETVSESEQKSSPGNEETVENKSNSVEETDQVQSREDVECVERSEAEVIPKDNHEEMKHSPNPRGEMPTSGKAEEADIVSPDEVPAPHSDIPLPPGEAKTGIDRTTSEKSQKSECEKPAVSSGLISEPKCSDVKMHSDAHKADTHPSPSQVTQEAKASFGRSEKNDLNQSRDHYSHNRDRYGDRNDDRNRHSDYRSHDRNHHDRNRDHSRSRDGYHDRNYNDRDYNRSYNRHGHGQQQGRYDDRQGNRGGGKGYYGNRDGGYYGDRRDQRGGYRGGGGGHYGNRGYY